MQNGQPRRSSRLALSIPIRVTGADTGGRSFSEDTTTLVVNLHGARIRLGRELFPQQVIRIRSLTTRLDATFRVVGKSRGGEGAPSSWGVECLYQGRNIWGVNFPELAAADQASVRVTVECPRCSRRETIYLDEPLLESLGTAGGISRRCLACRAAVLWRPVTRQDSRWWDFSRVWQSWKLVRFTHRDAKQDLPAGHCSR